MVTEAAKTAAAAESRKSRETSVRWRAASASVRGAAHQRSGLPNQDAALGMVSGKNTPVTLAVAAVSDGHGSGRHFRSQIGSSHAVNLTATLLEEFLTSHSDPSAPAAHEQLLELQNKIVTSWRASVESDYRDNPFSAEEMARLLEGEGEEGREAVETDPVLAYGATILAAATMSGSLLYLQLGDGDILTVSSAGMTSKPLPADDRLVANQTTSLCMPEAWKDFRAAWFAPIQWPALVLLCTDGYSNSFRSEKDFLQIGDDYLQLLRQQGVDAVAQELPRILSQASEEGSGDDISVALLLSDAVNVEASAASVSTGSALSTKSEMIHELTEQHAQQQKALHDLAQRVEQAQRENHGLRRVLLWAVVLVLAATAFLTRNHWRSLLPKAPEDKPHLSRRPDPAPGSGVQGGRIPSDLPGSPSAQAVWWLRIDDKQKIPLTQGAQLLTGEIVATASQPGKLYAEVAKEKSRLELINRSPDTWKVTTKSGKKSFVKTGESVVLAALTRIAFTPGKTAVLEELPANSDAKDGSER